MTIWDHPHIVSGTFFRFKSAIFNFVNQSPKIDYEEGVGLMGIPFIVLISSEHMV